jgi:hypothetical protein
MVSVLIRAGVRTWQDCFASILMYDGGIDSARVGWSGSLLSAAALDREE